MYTENMDNLTTRTLINEECDRCSTVWQCSSHEQPVRSILRLQPIMCNLSCYCIIIYGHPYFTEDVGDKTCINNAKNKNQAYVNSFISNLPSRLKPTKGTFNRVSCTSEHVIKNYFFICGRVGLLFNTVG